MPDVPLLDLATYEHGLNTLRQQFPASKVSFCFDLRINDYVVRIEIDRVQDPKTITINDKVFRIVYDSPGFVLGQKLLFSDLGLRSA